VLKQKVVAYEAKKELAVLEFDKQDAEEERKKTTDLVDKSSNDRKFLKKGSRDFANTILS
jgi:hypothetical protein